MRTNLWLTDPEKRRWLAIRKNAGRRIDPETALVHWRHAFVADPYGLDENLPSELRCIGRMYFACALDGETWVTFSDLPPRTVTSLMEREDRQRQAIRSGTAYFVDPEWYTGEHDQIEEETLLF